MSRSFPFAATILTLAGCAILLALGTWQVKRLAWKQNLLSHLETLYALEFPPRYDYEDILAAAAGGPYDFKRVIAKGRFLHDRSLFLRPRTYEGASGVHLYTPLALQGGGAVLVNRGFLPLGPDSPDDLAAPQKKGAVTVTGLLRRPEPPALFVPENRPAQDGWYRVDLPEIREALTLENLAPLVIYADSETPAPEGLNREALVWRPPNNHLGYAIFWYSMAGILLIIYYLRFWHGKKA